MSGVVGTISPIKIGTTLSGMADMIETHGHYQGGEYRSDECCLVLNPAFEAAGIRARRVIIRFLAKVTDCNIVRWNDETPTVDVIRTLRELAGELMMEAA